jgi:hypothetical protein
MLEGGEDIVHHGGIDLIFILFLHWVHPAELSLVRDITAILKDDVGQTRAFLVGDGVYSSITVALFFMILRIRVTIIRVVHTWYKFCGSANRVKSG